MSELDNQPQNDQANGQQPPVAQAPAPADDLSNVQLDMSKSVPVKEDLSNVQLDMSKSVPVSKPSGVVPQSQWKGATEATGIGPTPDAGTFHGWLRDVQADVKNGTSSTWVGSMLKKLGAKGTSYGNPESVGDFMAGPGLGVPRALEGTSEIANEIDKGVKTGDMSAGGLVRGVNKVVGGAFQSLGPAGLLVAPEGEGLGVVATAMTAQQVAQKTAIQMGADEDTAEMVGNVAAIVAGGATHSALHPVVERFGVAVNARTAAEQEYLTRSRELETARGQAAEMQQRAIEAAQKETVGQGSPAETDQARTLASEAAKNVANAQKAFDQASARRADAAIQVEKLNRKITNAAEKQKAQEYEAKASEAKKASDLFRAAVPSKGAHQYTPEDEDIARAHLEEAKANGKSIHDLPTAYEAVDDGRQGIEDSLKPYLQKYADEPLSADSTDTPKVRVQQKLDEMAKVDGNFAKGMNALSEFNITDPTVSEAQETITKLNNYNRAAMKGKSNWDVYNMIETDPEFAARYFMAAELRDALYDRLEGHGVEGARAARSETASLIRVRDAIGAQIRANRGGTAVRGSGNQSAMRGVVAKIMRKGGATVGAGVGAEVAGVPGAIAGAVGGEAAMDPLADLIAPRDITRDEHIAKSMKYKGTNRKPVKITGEGTPAVIPTEAIPPAPKIVPESIDLVPRENTELHAELAAHYGESNLTDSTYQELEDQLRADVAAKTRNGQDLTPAEKSLLVKILKADSADSATRTKAGTPQSQVEPPKVVPKSPEEEAKKIEKDAAAKAEGKEPFEVNPILHALGRPEDSLLVSHGTASKATAPVMVIPGLPEGMTQEMAQRHEWAHLAIGAIDGLSPIEIRSDLHPRVEKGMGATTVFDSSPVRDADGNVDPEALKTQMVQWLTQKMAGPASHEVFDGLTKDEAMDHPATRSDIRQARALVREANPDFTPKQIAEVVDAAYDRARDFLTKPHIADRIKTNAVVREEGLNQQLHASHGRVTKFADDVREAHNEYEGNDTEPNGNGPSEGGEKAAQPAEGKEKNEGRSESRGAEGAPKPAEDSSATSGATKLKGGLNASGLEASERPASFEEKIYALNNSNSRLKDLLRSGRGTEEERADALARLDENNDLINQLRQEEKTSPGESNISQVQGGHAGGGVASEEELARPGRFVKISRSGMPTDQGKTPDFNLGAGEAGYQVTKNGPRLVAGVETPATKRGVESYHKEIFAQ